MKAQQWRLECLVVLVLAICGSASGQELPLEPSHDSGQGVTGAFEGWFPNQDGTYSMLVGYFGRNLEQPIDVPIGPNNRIEPGGPDQGQPTHFLPGRGWGLFTVTVPKDFGDKRLTWTIVANGETAVIPLDLKPLWKLEPFKDANGDTPPYIGFSEDGPFVNGPRGQSESLNATVGTPLSLPVWVADDDKDPVALNPKKKVKPIEGHWILFRGPKGVKFANSAPPVEKVVLKSAPPGTPFNGKLTTTATFSEPGEYTLNLQVQDNSGGGPAGLFCCWSNAKVQVSVKP
jgi:hypothetical protein